MNALDVAKWIENNLDKQGTPEFAAAINAFKILDREERQAEESKTLQPSGVPGGTLEEQRMAAESEIPMLDTAGNVIMPPRTATGVDSEPVREMGFIEGIGEQITGRQRSTPITQELPDYIQLPELQGMTSEALKTSLVRVFGAQPDEIVQTIKANFPAVQTRVDEKNNVIFKSGVDNKEYALKPGFQVSDIPSVIGTGAAFLPASKLKTLKEMLVGAGATQTLIESVQSLLGGTFDREEIPAAAVGEIIVPGGGRVISSAREGIETAMRRGVEPELPPLSGAPDLGPDDVAYQEIGELARRASGDSIASDRAKTELAKQAQINPEALAAAERLNIELPPDVLSDSPQVMSAAGLTRSLAASEAEAAWEKTVKDAAEQADSVMQDFDAVFIEGVPSPATASADVKSKLDETVKVLRGKSGQLYDLVEQEVGPSSLAAMANLRALLNKRLAEAPNTFSNQERDLLNKINNGTFTYKDLQNTKTDVSNSAFKSEATYADQSEASLREMAHALMEDQLETVRLNGSPQSMRQLNKANLLWGKQAEMNKAIVAAYGKDDKGDLVTLMRQAINESVKGQGKKFKQLLSTVPGPLKREVVATALAQAFRGKAAGLTKGAFGFSEYASGYKTLRANPEIYSQIVKVLGPQSDAVLRDLYEISERVTRARARVLSTGKANQALVDAMTAENLIETVLRSTLAKSGVVSAASVFGPVGAGLASLASDAVGKAPKNKLNSAGKLFASQEFKDLAVSTATDKNVPKPLIKRAVMSKSFKAFADSIGLPSQMTAREKWLTSAVQASRSAYEEQE